MQACQIFDKINKTCTLSASVIDKNALILFMWSMLRRFLFSWIVIWIFPYSGIAIKDKKIFSCSCVKNWIKRDSWPILFCVMSSRLFNCFENELLWLSFDLGLDRTWTLFGSIKVINQISNGSWKPSTRTKFLHCFCWHDIL